MIIEVRRLKIQVLRVVDEHIGDRLEVKRKAAYLVDKDNSFKLMDVQLAVPNDPRYAPLETNLGIDRPKEGSNSAETVL
ncbi:hypothetical protein TNCV_3475571 [Trichonephila clavipes]|nr:hypothetical protein TNCV_3475571 [Trichonephila clavipes]